MKDSGLPDPVILVTVTYLWGSLNGKVHVSNPCTTEALQNEITRESVSVTKGGLQKVPQNLFRQCEAHLTALPAVLTKYGCVALLQC